MKNIVSLPLGFVSPGIYGGVISVSPNRFVPLAGCSCSCPRRLKGSAFSAELLPVQKIAPCGCPGLKPRKFPRPPPNPPRDRPGLLHQIPPPPKTSAAKQPAPPLKFPPFCARSVSTASRSRSISTPASGLTAPACPLIATDSSLKPLLPARRGQRRAARARRTRLRVRVRSKRAGQIQTLRAITPQAGESPAPPASTVSAPVAPAAARAKPTSTQNSPSHRGSPHSAPPLAAPCAKAANCVRITYRPFCGIVSVHTPAMSDVVE